MAFGEMRAFRNIMVTLKRGFALAIGTGKGHLRSTLSGPPKPHGSPLLPQWLLSLAQSSGDSVPKEEPGTLR
jgi:hypothetical protein